MRKTIWAFALILVALCIVGFAIPDLRPPSLQSVGAATGMISGLTGLFALLIRSPAMAKAVFDDPQAFQNILFISSVTALAGGWLGFFVFTRLS